MSAPGLSGSISSLANPRIKVYKSLATPKGRRDYGRFQIEGASLLEEALRAGIAIATVYCCPARLRDSRERRLVEELQQQVAVVEVSERVLRHMTSTVTPQALAAEAHIPEKRLSNIKLGKTCLVVAPVGIKDPGNLGTIIRTAHAAGATVVVTIGPCVDVYGPKVVRATMGSLFHLTVIPRVNSADFRSWCETNQLTVMAATTHAGSSLFATQFAPRTALLLGSETEGLPQEWMGPDITKVAIPMPGGTESLNVAVAAGIMIYEYRRQWPN
ncbi:MAG: TrmH family RNA methyltransferase [Candidatus Zipacnadales bacterium]